MKPILTSMTCAVLCLGVCPQAAVAGAWLRGEGEAFLSFSLRAFQPDGSSTTLTEQEIYAEYGLRPKLTLGGSARYADGATSEAQIFLRLPVLTQDGPSQLAAEFGLGATTTDFVDFDPYLKTGLSWGRGLQLVGRSGWINTDAVLQWPEGENDPFFKLDTTLGLTLSDRFQVMGQVNYFRNSSSDGTAFSPSVIYSPAKGKARYVAGVEVERGSAPDSALKFSVWRDF